MRRRSPSPFLLLGLPLLLIAGIWLGGHPERLPGFARDALVDDRQGRLYDEALDVIGDDYYRKIDKDRLLDSSLDAAVGALNDRFSAYFDPTAFRHFEEATTGEFEGVGMNVEQVPEGLRIITVFAGSPADRGGLRAGDVIVAVDGRSIKGKSSREATALIKGRAGTQVRLTVEQRSKQRQVSLERRRISIPVVTGKLREWRGIKVAHVSLTSFTSGAHAKVSESVRTLLRQGAKGVVLDLRDNGGGLLNEAVLVASVFIPEGKIVTTRGRARPERVFKAAGRAIDADVPVVVLVNGDSASASEIVTGALQDRRRATVVGTRTFGKGVFQEIKRLSNGGALDITVGEYFTPSGRNLGPRNGHKGGITPDVRASDDTETPKRDEALDTALRTVARDAA